MTMPENAKRMPIRYLGGMAYAEEGDKPGDTDKAWILDPFAILRRPFDRAAKRLRRFPRG